MRTTSVLASVLVATVIAVACGSKKPLVHPDDGGMLGSAEMGSADTGSGAGSDMGSGTGSDVGSGSGMGSDAGMGSGSGSGAGSGSAVAAEEGDAFLRLPREEKLAIMKDKVLPAMTRAFKAFDKKEFGKFGCKTCHGKGVADKTYKMPNPDLPALDFEKLQAGKDHPKTAEFMAKTVVPEMATLLGLPAATEQDHTGFGCLHCHTMKH